MDSLEKFLLMEQEHKLMERNVVGISYWMLMRFSLFNSLDEQLSSSGKNLRAKKTSKWSQIQKIVKTYTSRRYNIWNRLKKSEVLVVNHPRRIKSGEFYRCVYTDEIVKRMKLEQVQVLEYPYGALGHFEPIETKNCVYLDRIFSGDLIFRAFHTKIKRKKHLQLLEHCATEADFLRQRIKQEMGMIVSKVLLTDLIMDTIYYYQYTYRQFDKIIQKVSPKVLVEVVYYTRANSLLNEIAHAHNIPVIELQHGVMGKNHVSYNFLSDVGNQWMPDQVLTFSDYWNQTSRFPKERMLAVGYPFYEEQLAHYKQANKKNQILFVSQTVIGKELSEFAVAFSQLLQPENALEIIYKLHPGEYASWKTAYPKLLDSKIKVIDHNEQTIYELFSESIAQVGVFSTALYEGMGFGLTTYLVDAYRSQDLDPLVEQGYATRVHSPLELYQQWKQAAVCNSHQQVYFWKENALESIIREIEKAL